MTTTIDINAKAAHDDAVLNTVQATEELIAYAVRQMLRDIEEKPEACTPKAELPMFKLMAIAGIEC